MGERYINTQTGSLQKENAVIADPIAHAIANPLGVIANPTLLEAAYQQALKVITNHWKQCGVPLTDLEEEQRLNEQQARLKEGGKAFALQTIDLAYQLSKPAGESNGKYSSFQAVLEGVGECATPIDEKRIDVEAAQERWDFIKRQDGITQSQDKK